MLQLVCLKVVFKVNISSSFVYWYLVIEAMVVMSWIRKEQNPEKYAKNLSVLWFKNVFLRGPDSTKWWDLLTIRGMMVLKNTTFNYEEATRK
jgi:hypothetical protein